MKSLVCVIGAACLLISTGCDKGAPAGAQPDETEAELAQETPEEEKKEPEFEEHEEEAGEKIPVEKVDFDAAKLKDHLPAGDQLGGFAFNDAFGQNAVAFSRVDKKNEESTTATLNIKHIAQNGDNTRVVREYKEIVEECDADIILEPKFGDWSVTDVNDNSIAEATFAYTASCTSDISPNPHKVLLTEGGQKYALRGNTRVRPGGDEEIGGEFKADEMDPEFLEHAKEVWEKTSKGFGF